jgi:hypothetical protein
MTIMDTTLISRIITTMDTTIISGIIGAVATVIAALVGAWIGSKSQRDRDAARHRELSELLEIVTKALAVISRQVSKAEDPKEGALLKDNLDLLGEVRAPTSPLKPAEITVYPEEQNLVFVVQKDNPRPAFNVLTRLTNHGQQVGIVDGLEAILTGPEGVSFRFLWHLFYEYRRDGLSYNLRHTMSSYIHPIPIPPEGSRLLGIQFIGPDLGIDTLYSWPTGRYQVEITGWVNRSPDRRPTDFSSKFYINILLRDIAQLKEWIRWDDAAWARFPRPDSPDPDKAAGYPIRIVPS